MASKKSKQSDVYSAWSKHGDCRAEVDRMLALNANHNGGKVVGDPEAFIREFGGEPRTVLAARGDWWTEYLRVHGRDWKGPVLADALFLDELRQYGKKL